MIKKSFFFFLLVFLVSCTSKTIYPKPSDLIPKDTMSLLLKDLFLANAAKGVKNKNLQIRINYHPLVFEKFKIDSTRFYKSNFYYISTVDEYEDVLTDVLLSIEKEQSFYMKQKKYNDSIYQDSLNTLKKERLKIRDSIKKYQKFDVIPAKI